MIAFLVFNTTMATGRPRYWALGVLTPADLEKAQEVLCPMC